MDQDQNQKQEQSSLLYGCVICICDTSHEDAIVCIKDGCNTSICTDCLESYCEHTKSEMNKIPVCPKCSDVYDVDAFHSLKPLYVYASCIHEYLKKNQNYMTQMHDKVKYNEIIERMQKDKVRNFESFPSSIQTLVKVSFPTKYSKMMKINREEVRNQVTDKRKCISGVCVDGRLDTLAFDSEDGHERFLKCDTCELIFCNQCERNVTCHPPSRHQCLKEDLDSLELLKEFVKCPECHVPVQKIDGCNNLTCANCKTRFLNYTGERGGSGGGTQGYVQAKSSNRFTLHAEYVSSLANYKQSILQKVKKIEKLRNIDTPFHQMQPFMEPQYYLTEVDAERLLRLFNHIRSCLDYKREYNEAFNKIRQFNLDGTVEENMEEMNSLVKNITMKHDE